MTSPIEHVLVRLEKVKQRAPGQWSARCPAHADKSPSLSVRETPEGAVLLHCFAGCGVQAITAALNLDMASLFPPASRSGREPNRVQRLLTATQALELLDFEAHLVVIAAANVSNGFVLTASDRQRIAQAANRIAWLRTQSVNLFGARHA